MSKQRRLGIVDLWRFIGCLIIMCYHLPNLDARFYGENYPFATGWVYVEFFFIMTGYFTYEHFAHANKVISHTDEIGKNAIEYTFRKFSSFMPYVILAFAFKYVLVLDTQGFSMGFIADLIPEMLLLSRGSGFLPLLWYLSAMFIVFPTFCCICQMKHRYLVCTFSITFVIIVYDTWLTVLGVKTPLHLIRALAGLLMGILVWHGSRLVAMMPQRPLGDAIITAIEVLALSLAVLLTYRNSTNYVMVLLCFFVGFCIMLSGVSLTRSISSRFFSFLGPLSLVMYLNQESIAILINKVLQQDALSIKVVLYFVLNFIFSAVVYSTVKSIKSRVNYGRIDALIR